MQWPGWNCHWSKITPQQWQETVWTSLTNTVYFTESIGDDTLNVCKWHTAISQHVNISQIYYSAITDFFTDIQLTKRIYFIRGRTRTGDWKCTQRSWTWN